MLILRIDLSKLHMPVSSTVFAYDASIRSLARRESVATVDGYWNKLLAKKFSNDHGFDQEVNKVAPYPNHCQQCFKEGNKSRVFVLSNNHINRYVCVKNCAFW